MTRLVLRGLLARKTRVILTAVAVLLGVTMISGTYVYSDTIDRAFRTLFTDTTRGADVIVSGREVVEGRRSEAPSLPQRLVDRIQGLPEVDAAQGQVTGVASIVGRDGEVVNTGSSPALGTSALTAPFQSVDVTVGRLPAAGGEVAIGRNTVDAEGLELGDRVEIATQRPRRAFELVGIVDLPSLSFGGATLSVFDLPTAQRLFLKRGRVDTISVAGTPDTSLRELVSAVEGVLPPDAQARTVAEAIDEETQAIGDQLGILTTALLAFGFIAVFVGAFIIFNTFSITVAQRVREFALMRTMGATRRQVLVSVLAEALVIAIVASIAGLWLGLLFADGLSALLRAVSLDLPTTDAVLRPRTAVVALAAGLAVTLAASLLPAVRATRVAPMQALREGVGLPRSRLAPLVPWLAGLVGLAGVALVVVGLLADAGTTETRLGVTAGGAIALVVGVAMLSPGLVAPVARAVGWPLERLTSIVGRLARGNATRNPSRTAVSAAALMIGLSIVLFVTIFADGLRVSTERILDRAFSGDFAVYSSDGFSPIPAGSAGAVAQVPGVETVSAFRFGDARVSGGVGTVQANGLDPASVASVYNFAWVEGSDATLAGLRDDGVLVEENLAREHDLGPGDRLRITAPTGRSRTVVVRGVYDDPALLPGVTMPFSLYNRLFEDPGLAYLLVRLAPDADPERAERDIDAALSGFPEVRARSQQALKDEQADQVNQVLGLFFALLLLSVLVALFGIVNTLTLSIYERTRELGMMRAIGMTRRQVRRMVRYESVITAAIGGVLGLVLGLFFAWVVTRAVADQGIVFSVPWAQVALLLVLALLAGVLAAIPPARRASRLKVLEAIAYE